MVVNYSTKGDGPFLDAGSLLARSQEKVELSDPTPQGGDPNDRHFRTDHLLKNLRGRTISSGFITVLAQGIQFGLNLGSTMVLARLLTPQDFGLVAMVTTVFGF